MRRYDLVAAEVEITLNRFLDFDPRGRAYVIASDLERVRAEEDRNRRARAGEGEPAVSLGLQGDAIQPLVLRVNQGECLRVDLTHRLPGEAPVSFHVHGAGLVLADSGAPVLAREPASFAKPGETVRYAWWVAPDEREGTHYVHSHGDPRAQTGHGLFGAVVVEPAGSLHLDPRNGREGTTGWDAIIQTPDGRDFREFVLLYHEIGNERYRHMDRDGRLVELVDPFTSAYKPGGRAINYRSEPFLNRMRLQHERFGRIDESLAYSSYAFGDPATPIARSYLGDPVKQRLVHGGSEVFHVHHVHGGGTRWPRQPGSEREPRDVGLDKRPALLPVASERIDSQAIGPSESFDVEHECGSGGCQQGAGDYLVHCHVAHHYFAGMWMIWRVYNTLQATGVQQDQLPPLLELPERQGGVLPAVTSSELLGRTLPRGGATVTLDETTLADWVEAQLPPPGRPRGYDAAVLDWRRQGTLYLNEPDTDEAWPNHLPEGPGERVPIRFDPATGRLAYPFLRPHLARRPPFPPGRNPAPFLEPFGVVDGTPPPPGGNGDASLCPTGTEVVRFDVNAIEVPLTLNARLGVVDPVGQLFVLHEEEERVRAEPASRVPLAIRARAGEECLDLLLTSELRDTRENALLSKVGMHAHFVQFDVQASDGVTIGFNYEQVVRPFTVEGEALSAPARAGEDAVRLASGERFQPGVLVGVGLDRPDTAEVRRVQEVRNGRVRFTRPLEHDHGAGEIVSAEFVRYRWYPDVQFGTAYFHDHVAALSSWRHGLFGALIAEPPDGRFTHPQTGEEIRSGPVADILTEAAVSADVQGSFRELVLFIQDDNPLTSVGDSSGSSLNLRVEPLIGRSPDPARLLASDAHGDPETPIVEAYAGDPVVLRGLVSGTNDVHTLHVQAHAFRREPHSDLSSRTTTARLGISERFDAYLPQAGGPLARSGDYLIRNGRDFKFREGSWGLLRVHEPDAATPLRRLPGRERSPPSAGASGCPEGAPRTRRQVVALELPLPMLEGPGRVFALEGDAQALLNEARAPEPLVAYVETGACLVIELRNALADSAVSFHADLPAADPPERRALAVGRTGGRVIPPGGRGTYSYYAHPGLGPHVALVHDGADPLTNPSLGLYGAVVVVPAGTNVTHPETGENLAGDAGWRADVHPGNGPSYRSFTLFLQEADPVIGTAIMPYAEQVAGVVGLNYRRAPLAPAPPEIAAFLRAPSDPATPLMEAYAGDPLRVNVLVPFAEQGHVFSLEGHRWPMEPGMPGSSLLSATQVGALEALTLEILDGASAPGEYLYGDHREPYREAGLWGLLRVHPARAPGATLRPLPGAVP